MMHMTRCVCYRLIFHRWEITWQWEECWTEEGIEDGGAITSKATIVPPIYSPPGPSERNCAWSDAGLQ